MNANTIVWNRGLRTDDTIREEDWVGMTVQKTQRRIHTDTTLVLIYNRLIYKN